ncbi:MAG TPA: endonuclease III [Vicinamibacterales bacterium]|nr:endonuclease III [Vicinamibacterales bacterium]
MKPQTVVERIIDTLAEQHPNADTELRYTNAFELLAATILSAQSTDERVNMVTPALFRKYPDARAMATAKPADLEKMILSTGFFRQKSKALIGMAGQLVGSHGGQVPADMDKLTALPGVGRKTANVVLGHALGVPGLPVDRHVLRVSNRIGIAEGDDPVKVEAQLCGLLPPAKWTLASDVQILHGRRVCKPKPLCGQCSVRDDCDYYRNEISHAVGRTLSGPQEDDPSTRSGSSRALSRDDKPRPTTGRRRPTKSRPGSAKRSRQGNGSSRVRKARR